ncbi:hypothetical protein [Actinomyces respiraculi]|nr:hypothetical protein [Actinomyces respiraculi]
MLTATGTSLVDGTIEEDLTLGRYVPADAAERLASVAAALHRQGV